MSTQSIDLKSLTQPLNSNGSPADAVTGRFNNVFGGRWSFRIIEHQVRDSEVIVLGELGADGAIRQQFGKATITFDSDPSGAPSLADHLTKAADDALVQCAYAFGIGYEAEQEHKKPAAQSTSAKPKTNNGNGDRKLTNRQLAAIFGLGKANGFGQKDVIDLTSDRYGREPMELTVSEASELIGEFSQKNEKE